LKSTEAMQLKLVMNGMEFLPSLVCFQSWPFFLRPVYHVVPEPQRSSAEKYIWPCKFLLDYNFQIRVVNAVFNEISKN
jgi:hypothetical protein